MKKKLFTFFSLFILILNLSAKENEYSAQELIYTFASNYNSLVDYQCRINEWCTEGKKFEKRTINFYFKKPRKIRVDILVGNRPLDTGTVGIYMGGDTIIGKKKGIVLELPKNNALATTIRGVPFDKSDLQAIVERLLYHLENSQIEISHIKRNVYEIICIPEKPEEIDGITKEVIHINTKKWLPLLSDSYEGDKVVQHVEWSRYILNVRLPDDVFHVHYNPGELAEAGIETIHHVPVE